MATLLHKIHDNETILSAVRFAAVGLLGTFLDFTLFFTFQVFLNLPILAANAVSYSTGIVNNYYLHRTWTFKVSPHKAVSKQFALFVVISLIALAINSVVVFELKPLFALHLSDPALAALLAKILATAAGLSWNFFANTFWTFHS